MNNFFFLSIFFNSLSFSPLFAFDPSNTVPGSKMIRSGQRSGFYHELVFQIRLGESAKSPSGVRINSQRAAARQGAAEQGGAAANTSATSTARLDLLQRSRTRQERQKKRKEKVIMNLLDRSVSKSGADSPPLLHVWPCRSEKSQKEERQGCRCVTQCTVFFFFLSVDVSVTQH